MNILIVSQYFWPENFRINDLALALKERGHQVTVLTGIPNYPQGKFYDGYRPFSPKEEEFQGIKVIRVPLIPRGKKKIQLVLNYFSFAFLGALLGPLFCRKQYDAIFVFEVSPITVGIPAIAVKKLTKSPIFFWVQDLWPESLVGTKTVKSKKILGAVDKLVRFIYNRCDRILVSSESFIDKIVRQGQSKQKISFFPQWAEPLFQVVTVDQDAPERKELPEGFRVTFAGNIGVAQSPETIIKAADLLKEYKEIKWVILGDGRMRSWMIEEVKKRGLEEQVYLLGSRPLETMPTYYALSDALLVTLKQNPIFAMTIPAKVQSYMACGKPIVASLDGEGGSIIEKSGSGVACPAEDHEGLANAVLKLYNATPEERKTMGTNAKQYGDDHFNRDNLIDQLLSDFKTLGKN